MKIVFFGTPGWAVASLKALAASPHHVVAAVSNPDRPAGRGYELVPPPVKVTALTAGIRVEQPDKAREPGFRQWLEGVDPDVCIVVAYGKILPGDLLEVPPLGFLNLHFSLLPAYRGAAPVQRAVMDGVTETGVSIIRLTEGMDEGPILATRTVAIEPRETAGELGERMAEVGADLLLETLDPYAAGDLVPVEQDHERATYAPKIPKEEARVDWSWPRERIVNMVRGMNPAPVAWTELGAQRLKLYRLEHAERGDVAPGKVQIDDGGRLLISAMDGWLEVREIQAAGKKRMTGEELARGLRIDEGLTLT